MTLTAVILTKNNQSTIRQLISSLSWCDQVMIIDDNSTDQTAKIAQKMAAQVLSKPLRNNFAAQRNYALTKTQHEWIFFIDADELPSSKLNREIRRNLKTTHFNGFTCPRIDVFLGRHLLHGETGNIKLVRLARSNSGRWIRPVHEFWQITPPLGNLRYPLYHFPHPNLNAFFDKVNLYTQIEANYHPHAENFFLIKLLVYPTGKFIYNYFFKLGLLDGFPGLTMAFMMSLHSLVVRIKQYEQA